MNDFNVGRDIKAGRDVIFNENTQQFKLLIHCNNDELKREELHRRKNLNNEKKSKFSNFAISLAFGASLFFVAAIFFWFKGDMNLYSLFLGITGIFISIRSFRLYEMPSEFEQRQINALKEINMLLRERGAR